MPPAAPDRGDLSAPACRACRGYGRRNAGAGRWLIFGQRLGNGQDDHAAVALALLRPPGPPDAFAAVETASVDDRDTRLPMAQQVSDLVGEPGGDRRRGGEIDRAPFGTARD